MNAVCFQKGESPRRWLFAGLVLVGAAWPCVAIAADAKAVVWPAAPAAPRIAFVQSFSEPKDLGIKKGFFRRFGEIFTGSETRRLIRPMSVLALDGVIYVGDPGAKAVHRFDTRRQRYALIKREGHAALPSPVGLAHDKNGKVYIADSVLGKIFVLGRKDKFATPLTLDTALTQPTGIAVDLQNSNLYVTDTSSHQVKVFNKDGNLVRAIGQRGDRKGTFNYPTMLWLSSPGELMVTDSLNFRIQTFSVDGTFTRGFGKLGNATGYLSRPKGVASDVEENIYVVDSLFHAMQIFDKSGSLLLSIGKQGKAIGEFWLPTGIYIAADRKIYVADSHNQRIQVFRPVTRGAS